MKIPKLQVGDRIEVHWLDAEDSHDDEWILEKDALKEVMDAPVETIGFYLGRTKHAIWLFNNRETKNKNVNNRCQVPIGCVTKIIILEEKR
jgi:hypothetical protein